MGLFSDDPNFSQNLLNFSAAMAQAASQPGARMGGAFGAGVQGMNQGAIQNAQAKNMQLMNQMGQLNLQRTQAMQPLILNQIKDMVNPAASSSASNGPNSAADAQFRQAYMLAMMSGKTEDAAKVLQSWAEHNPQLAGQIKAEQEKSTPKQTASGTYILGGGAFGKGNTQPSSAPAFNTHSASAGSPTSTQQMREEPTTDEAYSSQEEGIGPKDGQVNLKIQSNTGLQNNKSTQATPKEMLATDGKPYTSLWKNSKLYPSDLGGTAKYNLPNTKAGQSMYSEYAKSDDIASQHITDTAANANQMLGRLHDIADAYHSSQAGTLIAQHPDIANKLIGAGIIDNAGKIHDVANYQRVMSDLAVETMAQIKAATAGTQQSKILATEFNAIKQALADPKSQPEAVHSILAVTQGMGDYNKDLANGWQIHGGVGNRLANGYTLRPNEYASDFYKTHSLDDYIAKAKKDIGPLRGETANKNSSISNGWSYGGVHTP